MFQYVIYGYRVMYVSLSTMVIVRAFGSMIDWQRLYKQACEFDILYFNNSLSGKIYTEIKL